MGTIAKAIGSRREIERMRRPNQCHGRPGLRARLRQLLSSNAELARKLDAMEKKYGAQFKVVFDAIRQLMSPPETKRKKSVSM